jgi:hypothetical protein
MRVRVCRDQNHDRGGICGVRCDCRSHPKKPKILKATSTTFVAPPCLLTDIFYSDPDKIVLSERLNEMLVQNLARKYNGMLGIKQQKPAQPFRLSRLLQHLSFNYMKIIVWFILTRGITL